MNKYAIIGIVGVLVVIGGVAYKAFIRPESANPVVTGEVKEVTVTADRDEWRFSPEEIVVNRGDKIIMTVVNEDDYDHGIAIDAFGISQRMPANDSITFEFVATQAGDFPFYCSVPCGEGEVEGKLRTHFDMIGTIKVQNLIQGN